MSDEGTLMRGSTVTLKCFGLRGMHACGAFPADSTVPCEQKQLTTLLTLATAAAPAPTL